MAAAALPFPLAVNLSASLPGSTISALQEKDAFGRVHSRHNESETRIL
jgi:hypothetical protein